MTPSSETSRPFDEKKNKFPAESAWVIFVPSGCDEQIGSCDGQTTMADIEVKFLVGRSLTRLLCRPSRSELGAIPNNCVRMCENRDLNVHKTCMFLV